MCLSWALFLNGVSPLFQSIRPTPSNEAVSIDFKPVTLRAGENRYTKVASISFDGKHFGKLRPSVTVIRGETFIKGAFVFGQS